MPGRIHPAQIFMELKEGVAIITLNRPEARNAINDDMRSRLNNMLEQVSSDDTIRALIITGTGKGFCAGGDIKGMQKRMEAPIGEVAFNGWKRQQNVFHSVAMLHNLSKPTIAAVNGSANGLGCDMALSCDFILSSSQASFAMSYIARGLIPDGGGLYFLPRRVGLSVAKDLIFSGRTVLPEEARQIGMIDRISAPEDLLSDARQWALELGAGSATALGLSKAILNQTFEITKEQAFAMSTQAQGICHTSSAHRASVEAFLTRKTHKV